MCRSASTSCSSSPSFSRSRTSRRSHPLQHAQLITFKSHASCYGVTLTEGSLEDALSRQRHQQQASVDVVAGAHLQLGQRDARLQTQLVDVGAEIDQFIAFNSSCLRKKRSFIIIYYSMLLMMNLLPPATFRFSRDALTSRASVLRSMCRPGITNGS